MLPESRWSWRSPEDNAGEITISSMSGSVAWPNGDDEIGLALGLSFSSSASSPTRLSWRPAATAHAGGAMASVGCDARCSFKPAAELNV